MFGLLLRMVIAMTVVIGVMFLAARVMRNRVSGLSGVKRNTNEAIEIVARHHINRSASIAVARVGTKQFAIGLTDSQITLLGDVDVIDLQHSLDAEWTEHSEDLATTGLGSARKGMLEQLRDRTTRRT